MTDENEFTSPEFDSCLRCGLTLTAETAHPVVPDSPEPHPLVVEVWRRTFGEDPPHWVYALCEECVELGRREKAEADEYMRSRELGEG